MRQCLIDASSYNIQLSMKRHILTTAILFLCAEASLLSAGNDHKLTGTVIGTTKFIDYATNQASTTVNTRECAFDGDLNTYFATYERSYTWVGLDLGEPHVITGIGWAPPSRSNAANRVLLGVFEGANSPDFMDALPLHIITEPGTAKNMSYANVSCSKGFRYVRYVGPSDMRCNIGELEFYGHPGEGDELNLWRLTNLPTVSIHTENNVEPYDKVHNINAVITVISDRGNKVLRSDTGVVRLRGNYSINFDKKPYRIKFDKKHRVVDSPAKAKKWVLVNNFGDKTLMRNLLAFELSRCLDMPYTPYAEAVDVLLNGEYKGNYQLCDHIDVKKERVNLVDSLTEERADSLSTTAFLVEVDARASSEPSWFKSTKGTPITIHYPDDDDITPLQKSYIEEQFNRMEENWQEYLDLSTFLRHFLVGELSGNTDTYWSVYMYKHRENDTIFTGPVWDFDLAFDNDERTFPVCGKTDFIYRSGGSNIGYMRTFADNIVIKDAAAKQRLIEIWDQARQDRINERYLIAYLDSLEEYLQQSQKLNFIRWPIMNDIIHKNPSVLGSYEAEVQNVRRYLRERLLWMDNRLGYTYHDGIAAAELDPKQPMQVFNIMGQPCATDLKRLPKGIYIVRQGKTVRKIR